MIISSFVIGRAPWINWTRTTVRRLQASRGQRRPPVTILKGVQTAAAHAPLPSWDATRPTQRSPSARLRTALPLGEGVAIGTKGSLIICALSSEDLTSHHSKGRPIPRPRLPKKAIISSWEPHRIIMQEAGPSLLTMGAGSMAFFKNTTTSSAALSIALNEGLG